MQPPCLRVQRTNQTIWRVGKISLPFSLLILFREFMGEIALYTRKHRAWRFSSSIRRNTEFTERNWISYLPPRKTIINNPGFYIWYFIIIFFKLAGRDFFEMILIYLWKFVQCFFICRVICTKTFHTKISNENNEKVLKKIEKVRFFLHAI